MILQILTTMTYLPNSCNKIVEQIQYEKRLTLSSEKCELLKVNSRCKHGPITVNGENIKSFGVARYLGDQFNAKGDYVDLCKEPVGRAKDQLLN